MSEDRAGLHFISDIKDEPAKRKLRELQSQTDQYNQALAKIERRNVELGADVALMTQDAFAMIEYIQRATGIQVSATTEAAIGMVQTGALAARHVAQIWAAHPALAPLAAAWYASIILMEIQAVRDVRGKHEETLSRMQAVEQMGNIAMKYGG